MLKHLLSRMTIHPPPMGHHSAPFMIAPGSSRPLGSWPATSPADTRALVDPAAAAGVVAPVPFVYRFCPTVREARARIARDDAGSLWLLHGSSRQDWLETDHHSLARAANA